MKPRVFVVQPIPEVALEILREVAEVTVFPHLDRQISHDELVANARRSDYIFAMGDTLVPAEVINANPDLKGISVVSRKAGNVDLEAARARRLPVAITHPAEEIYQLICKVTGDLTMGMLLALAYRLFDSDRYTRCGKFQEQTLALMGVGCPGKTLGLIGLGRVAEYMIPRARAFEMDVVYSKRTRLAARAREAARRDVAAGEGRRAPARRLRVHRLRLQPEHAPPDRGPGARADEADGVPPQHRPGPHRGRAGDGAGAAGRDDRRRRAGRL